MKKFGKNREVDSRWLSIPIKYMLNFTDGANVGSCDKTITVPIEEQYEKHCQWLKDEGWWDDHFTLEEYKKILDDYPYCRETKHIPSKHDKTFCIIEMSKKWAICGWRNNGRCSIGMPIKCPIVKRKRRTGIVYKDKFYPIDGSSGWVL